MILYSLDVLLSQFGTSLLLYVQMLLQVSSYRLIEISMIEVFKSSYIFQIKGLSRLQKVVYSHLIEYFLDENAFICHFLLILNMCLYVWRMLFPELCKLLRTQIKWSPFTIISDSMGESQAGIKVAGRNINNLK